MISPGSGRLSSGAGKPAISYQKWAGVSVRTRPLSTPRMLETTPSAPAPLTTGPGLGGSTRPPNVRAIHPRRPSAQSLLLERAWPCDHRDELALGWVVRVIAPAASAVGSTDSKGKGTSDLSAAIAPLSAGRALLSLKQEGWEGYDLQGRGVSRQMSDALSRVAVREAVALQCPAIAGYPTSCCD